MEAHKTSGRDRSFRKSPGCCFWVFYYVHLLAFCNDPAWILHRDVWESLKAKMKKFKLIQFWVTLELDGKDGNH